jgi:hypothetical protein
MNMTSIIGDTAILYLAYAHKLCLCLDRREYIETALSTQGLKYCVGVGAIGKYTPLLSCPLNFNKEKKI